ncbi:major facilitator superfamily domain-containing protein 6 isoform X2 [Megalopta genalis]|nr:major facilitator superfamily domain-containing protein 6 isoform X2 [Megalopta genalis]XP_033342281.1 major facilitator superfamily domain-containing protein 6 isoform X2 [Megalopta genalis]XP_033342287.1 major facilitator superfamily domain-containing protein 6 isoform X2 [Megalopta genalis]
MKLNYKQLPVKAHYFFFMAAMGPILPFFPVYGKQLGVSPVVMGSITAVLPILFLIAKPAFGYLVDYFVSWRKTIFIMILATTSISFICMYFLPALPEPILPNHMFENMSCASLKHCSPEDTTQPGLCMGAKYTTCHWNCTNNNFSVLIQFEEIEGEVSFTENNTCLTDTNAVSHCSKSDNCKVSCDNFNDKHCLYTSITFWGFIILMSLGNIGFNVCNSISDAICFDVLGEGGQMSYGRQRVWGTIGFGIAAFLAGYAVDYWSEGKMIKVYTPAFLLIFIFSFFDILCCRKLKLPIMSGSGNILKDVFQLLKLKPIIIFLCFATIAGIIDSFIIYFLFWYLEDLALVTGHMSEIKLIEGLIVAAQTLGGEVIFFSLSGKILKKLGFGYTFTFCFVSYALRLGLISLASTPWWVIPIELFMQGPTYALCYTSIVAYASKIAPPGTSATVQGIVAGMDDGFGFAIGSLVGGILYKLLGGVTTLRLLSSLAAVAALMYFILHLLYLKHTMPETKSTVEWKSPEEAKNACVAAET